MRMGKPTGVRPKAEEHLHYPCVFVEGNFINRLPEKEYMGRGETMDLLCEQLWADHWGFGVNGVAVTRFRRR